MFNYKPKPADLDSFNYKTNADDIGWLATEFEPFTPNPTYPWNERKPCGKDAWKIVVPKTAPPIGRIPEMIERMVTSMWKFAEPAASANRGKIMMGTRGVPVSDTTLNERYHVQVRPTTPNITTSFPNKTQIASDWKVFEQLERTNAVAFRGDTRTPDQVIKAGGFRPPNSRTDRYYLENNIFNAFDSYMSRRYQRKIDKAGFLAAVNRSATSAADQKLLVDYAMWRRITEGESMHLGRMVENECLKGYISTARAIDTSISFGTAFNTKPGWLYLTIVHAGFIVPWSAQKYWGSGEAEIAQWGEIPPARIVGFVHLDKFKPDGPIFIRKSFRKSEPAAFKEMFNVMSGKTPNSM